MRKFLFSTMVCFILSGCAFRKTVSYVDCNYVVENLRERCNAFSSIYGKGSGVISTYEHSQGFQFALYGKKPDSLAVEIIGPFGISFAQAFLCGESVWVQTVDSIWSGDFCKGDSVFIIPVPPGILLYFLARLPAQSLIENSPNRCDFDGKNFMPVFETDEYLMSLKITRDGELVNLVLIGKDNPSGQIKCVFDDDNSKIEIYAPELGVALALKFSEWKINKPLRDGSFILPSRR